MIGRIDPQHREVIVVGAGIAGLLIAYELTEQGYDVTVLDRASRAGGLIATRETSSGIVESAAHSFLATPTVTELCARLGVELTPVRNRARFVLRDGKLRRFPLGFGETLEALGRAAFVRGGDARTMEEFALRHLGRAALDYLVSPMLTGIYAAAPAELSVAAAFPVLAVPPSRTLLTTRRQRARGTMMAPLRGMGALVAALEARLRIVREHAVSELPQTPNLVLAVPAAEAARLVPAGRLADALARVRYSPLTSATVFADARDFARVPEGVGVLMPAVEKRRVLGILFNSSAFAGRVSSPERVSLTVMLKEKDPELAIREELESLFGLKPRAPLEVFVNSHERAIPIYDENLKNTWRLAAESWCSRPGRILFGNYTGQVSLRGMIETASATRSTSFAAGK